MKAQKTFIARTTIGKVEESTTRYAILDNVEKCGRSCNHNVVKEAFKTFILCTTI